VPTHDLKKRFADKKSAYRLRDYAILEDREGQFEYIKWTQDPKTKKLSWVRGRARPMGDVLALTSIISEEDEKEFRTLKEVRKALKRLPDWWNKTTYHCVLVGRQACLVNHCVSGKPLEEDSKETARIESLLRQWGISLLLRQTAEASKPLAQKRVHGE